MKLLRREVPDHDYKRSFLDEAPGRANKDPEGGQTAHDEDQDPPGAATQMPAIPTRRSRVHELSHFIVHGAPL